jgi:sugar lactone lactonase YvrE
MRKRPRLPILAVLTAASLSAAGCGRAPSSLLRQGQLPINDFPLYLTEGATGMVWKIDRDRTKTLVASGLTDPKGVATDRFGNVYVAEYGAGRLLKVDPDGGDYTVVREDLQHPSVVAVDSFGEIYVAQDDAMNVVRISDAKEFGHYSSLPTALAFGVNDQPVVGLYDANKVLWGWDENGAETADVPTPVNATIDGTGRVYVAQGDPTAGQVFRFHQHEPGPDAKLVADGLYGPAGIAVDLIGNIFLVEQGAGRVVLVTYDGHLYSWLDDVSDPQYLAFTQY